MNKKLKKEINVKIGDAFSITLDFAFTTVKLFILMILVVGSLSAFLLYVNMFPEKALELQESSTPIFVFLINMLQIVVGVALGVLIGWLSFNILEPVMTRAKKRREQRREEFLEDLSEKLKKKLKKK